MRNARNGTRSSAAIVTSRNTFSEPTEYFETITIINRLATIASTIAPIQDKPGGMSRWAIQHGNESSSSAPTNVRDNGRSSSAWLTKTCFSGGGVTVTEKGDEITSTTVT